MPKYLLSILLLCTLAAPVRAQLVFTPAEWDFGTIREANGKVAHTFTAENRGDKPVVILDVVVTCGCTVPDFSKQPILPGGRTTVKVTFDPMNRPGTFVKELYVYSAEREKIATLAIRGSVTPRPKSIAELYPVDAGNGLRLTSSLAAFSYIYQGQPVATTIGCVNDSDRTITLDLREESSSGLMRLDYPRKLAPGEQGEINLSYAIPADKPRYGTLRDLFEVYVNGKATDIQLFAHGIGIDKPTGAQNAPKSEPSLSIVKFGTVKHSASLQRSDFTITNTGSGTLIIRAVETGDHIGCTLKPGLKIPAGGSAKGEITLNPGAQDYGVVTDQLTLITNDPARPMQRIRVTALIQD